MAGDMFTDGGVGEGLVVGCAKDLEENRMVFVLFPQKTAGGSQESTM